jgi:hypothetical protein
MVAHQGETAAMTVQKVLESKNLNTRLSWLANANVNTSSSDRQNLNNKVARLWRTTIWQCE